MGNRPGNGFNGDDHVSATYREVTDQQSPSSHLDERVLALASNELERADDTAVFRPQLLGISVGVLVASAAVVLIAVVSLTVLSQPSTLQPATGTETSKPPEALPPIPTIEAPVLVPPSEQDGQGDTDCAPDVDPPCAETPAAEATNSP